MAGTFVSARCPTAAAHADELRRQIVWPPVRALSNDLRAVGADFLLQLAQRGAAWILALVDAALRHLPRFGRHIDAAGNEDPAGGVEQHQADARPIR